MPTPKKYLTSKGEVRYEVRYRNLDNRSTRQRGFTTIKAAEKWALENATRLATGTHIPASAQRKLAGPFVETYINRTATIRPTTAASRTSTARTWVLPTWANRPVGRIDQEGVKAWVEELHQQGVSAATIEKAVGVLRGSLALAVSSKALASNPVVGIELPKQVRRDNAYLTAEQVAHLVSHAGRQALLVSFLAYTGLRFGEAAALRVRDLDLHAGRVRVRASVTEVNGKLVEGPPKNGKARSVPLAHFLRAPLASSIQGRSSDGLVFRAARGGPLRANTWRSRDFAVAVQAAQEAAPLWQAFSQPCATRFTPHRRVSRCPGWCERQGPAADAWPCQGLHDSRRLRGPVRLRPGRRRCRFGPRSPSVGNRWPPRVLRGPSTGRAASTRRLATTLRESTRRTPDAATTTMNSCPAESQRPTVQLGLGTRTTD